MRLRLLDPCGRPFLGLGGLWLLQAIASHRSIRAGAASMALSYPKALRLLRELEEAVGRPVLIRQRGGRDHGGAQLTPFAVDLVARYRQLLRRVEGYAQQEYSADLATLLAAPSDDPAVSPDAVGAAGRRRES